VEAVLVVAAGEVVEAVLVVAAGVTVESEAVATAGTCFRGRPAGFRELTGRLGLVTAHLTEATGASSVVPVAGVAGHAGHEEVAGVHRG
jgi:hypothetical protein